MNESPMVAKIVVNLSLDREFDYRVPERLQSRMRIGCRVWVPFGRGERMGYVVGLTDRSAFPELKEVIRIEGEKEEIPENLLTLARWMADYYCCAREQAVRTLLPAVVRQGKVKQQQRRFVTVKPGLDLAEVLPVLEKRAKKQALVLQTLVRLGGVCELRNLLREADAGEAVVTGLAKAGRVLLEQRIVDRDPFAADEYLPTQPLQLTPEQDLACRAIVESMVQHRGGVLLLHGVTGSGKTEVYLQTIARCLELGREAIVLVPEIALTPQTMERFRCRFGEIVCAMHSRLSDGERFDEWMRVHTGRAKIVIGARSALFAPFNKLGLIVVDDEHENTYKQEEAPRYNARDVAVMRGRFEQATVVLGSATPSLESRYNCEIGKYQLLELPRRVDHQLMPVMDVIDMRAEAMLRGSPQLFSRRLQEQIRDRLDKGEQTILFLNRRGYASQMICTKCGFVASCDDCSTAYTYHRQDGHLICHLCGKVLPAPAICPQCRDEGIRFTGLGTERVETIARKLFPGAVLARMDSDTMTAKDSYTKTLGAFRAGKIQILIGTQMIAKGLHFPKVTLVGIIFADMGLHLPDFRAGERTFQLLVQVAGRAGRGDIPGRVVVQTYTPFHPVLQHAAKQDFMAFYHEEMETRKALTFPPAAHLVAVHFQGPSEIVTSAVAEAFVKQIQPMLESGVLLTGPIPAPIARIRRHFRYQVLLRGGRILRLVPILRSLLIERKQADPEVEIFADVDPQNLL